MGFQPDALVTDLTWHGLVAGYLNSESEHRLWVQAPPMFAYVCTSTWFTKAQLQYWPSNGQQVFHHK